MPDSIWAPGPIRRQTANIKRFVDLIRSELDPAVHDYWDLYDFSIRQPDVFWRAIWEFGGVLGKAGDVSLQDVQLMPGAKWFPQASLNFAENLLRYRDQQAALIFCSETGTRRQLNYAELYTEVMHTASAMRAMGVSQGDRVAAYMPNLPETIVAMLAASSIGAIFSSCSPDFGIAGVVDRFGQIKPKVLFCAAAYSYNGKTHDCLQKVAGIISQVDSIERVVVVPFADGTQGTEPQGGHGLGEKALWFENFKDPAAQTLEFAQLPFDHPLYILYSSGTTGTPKCIVHGAGGTLLQHLNR